MTQRKLATPGALLIAAGAFLLYWGLRELGIVGKAPTNVATNAVTPAISVGRSA